jgi:hypothetical protein
MNKTLNEMHYLTNTDLAKFVNPAYVNTYLERQTKSEEVIILAFLPQNQRKNISD